MFGNVTRRNICQPEAPSKMAASSSWLPWLSIIGTSSRTTNGQVTKMVTNTMPGQENMIWILCASSQPPSRPLLP
ncbi:hypothetical protein D3C87_1969240 [compost metagenome]